MTCHAVRFRCHRRARASWSELFLGQRRPRGCVGEGSRHTRQTPPNGRQGRRNGRGLPGRRHARHVLRQQFCELLLRHALVARRRNSSSNAGEPTTGRRPSSRAHRGAQPEKRRLEAPRGYRKSIATSENDTPTTTIRSGGPIIPMRKRRWLQGRYARASARRLVSRSRSASRSARSRSTRAARSSSRNGVGRSVVIGSPRSIVTEHCPHEGEDHRECRGSAE